MSVQSLAHLNSPVDGIARSVPSSNDEIDESYGGSAEMVLSILSIAFSNETEPKRDTPREIMRCATLTSLYRIHQEGQTLENRETFFFLLKTLHGCFGAQASFQALNVRQYYLNVYKDIKGKDGVNLLSNGKNEDKQVIGYAFILVMVYAYVVCVYGYGRKNNPRSIVVVLAASSDCDKDKKIIFTPHHMYLPKLAELFDILCCLYHHARVGKKEAVLLAALWCVGEKHIAGSGSKTSQGEFMRACRNMNDFLALKANKSVVTDHVSDAYRRLNHVHPTVPSPQYTFPPPSCSNLSIDDFVELASCLPSDDDDEENASSPVSHLGVPWLYTPANHHQPSYPPTPHASQLHGHPEIYDTEVSQTPFHHFNLSSPSTPHASQHGPPIPFHHFNFPALSTSHASQHGAARMDHGHLSGRAGTKRSHEEVEEPEEVECLDELYQGILLIERRKDVVDKENSGSKVRGCVRKGAKRVQQVLITHFFPVTTDACSSPRPSPSLQSPPVIVSTNAMTRQPALIDPRHPPALHDQPPLPPPPALVKTVSADFPPIFHVGNENINNLNFLPACALPIHDNADEL